MGLTWRDFLINFLGLSGLDEWYCILEIPPRSLSDVCFSGLTLRAAIKAATNLLSLTHGNKKKQMGKRHVKRVQRWRHQSYSNFRKKKEGINKNKLRCCVSPSWGCRALISFHSVLNTALFYMGVLGERWEEEEEGGRGYSSVQSQIGTHVKFVTDLQCRNWSNTEGASFFFPLSPWT